MNRKIANTYFEIYINGSNRAAPFESLHQTLFLCRTPKEERLVHIVTKKETVFQTCILINHKKTPLNIANIFQIKQHRK